MAIANKNQDSSSPEDVSQYCRALGERALAASRGLRDLSTAIKNEWLERAAERLQHDTDAVLEANAADVAQAVASGLSPSAIDRLTLNRNRISGMVQGLRHLVSLSDPVGEVLGGGMRPNGLEVRKVRVPLGVILFIYESRPNVTVDAAAIAVKSGNAIILRGGKESLHSSSVLAAILQESAKRSGVPQHAIQFVQTPDRTVVGELLQLSDCIDLVIPRGGESLIRRVAAEARMPVLKHYAGNCHVYIDEHADLSKGVRIAVNAKTQRMGVCNAAESLLVHVAVARAFLAMVAEPFRERGVELRGDPAVCEILADAVPATESDWSAEYLGPILSVRIVHSLDEAIDHIQRYGSGHTDAIVTRDIASAQQFARGVDSAAVMINCSTRFHDGGELGLGAEIGISTDKLHARGPCGLQELTTYKYIVVGDGHVRE